MDKFNLSQYNLYKDAAARKRIRDRGIRWEESYHERSAPLKKRLDKLIGPGSYRRWEGHDYTTNSDYFIVVGPSLQRSGQKSFFAGVKKLPEGYKRKKMKTYAPSGKYFTNIMSALSHASKMWGIRFPENQISYDESVLKDIEIPRHIKG